MQADRPLLLGFHDFLNAQPLTQVIAKDFNNEFELTLDSPAEISKKLISGKLDLAMIPSIEYLRHLDKLSLIQGIAIASFGPVLSVLFAHSKPLDKIKTIACDLRSRTSVASLKILFKDSLQKNISFVPHVPDIEKILDTQHAALIIGDPAFHFQDETKKTNWQCHDLSEVWKEKTGLPFVHAVIATQKEILNTALEERLILKFREIKKWSAEEIGEITRSEKTRSLGISPEICRSYLTEHILYDLGPQEKAGLQKFHELCLQDNLL